MRFGFLGSAVAVAWALGLVSPAAGSTLIRASLDELVGLNRLVLVGEVLDAHSYWNSEGTFILTDLRIAPSSVLKGRPMEGEVVVTIPGGSVGDLSTVIVGGAELVPGRSYMLFLNEESLPGARALTVRDHCQGVFDLDQGEHGLRAISQANRHPLLPDARGEAAPPGGAEGLPLQSMSRAIREIAGRAPRKEMN